MSGKGIFLNGDLARSFRQQALALSQGEADEDAVDAFIAGYAGWPSSPWCCTEPRLAARGRALVPQ
jgi:hypothetical protein